MYAYRHFKNDVLNKKYWKEYDPEYMIQDFEGFPRNLYYESEVSQEVFEYIDIVSRSEVEKETIKGIIAINICNNLFIKEIEVLKFTFFIFFHCSFLIIMKKDCRGE